MVCLPGPRITHESDGLFYLMPSLAKNAVDAIAMCANLGFRLFKTHNLATMEVARKISSKFS